MVHEESQAHVFLQPTPGYGTQLSLLLRPMKGCCCAGEAFPAIPVGQPLLHWNVPGAAELYYSSSQPAL